MASLGVVPLPQMRFLHEFGDVMARLMGPERADRLYRHASFLRAGLRVPGRSDRPVADGRPLAGIESMVLRTTGDGTVIGPDERVAVMTALRAYTVDTAWVAGEERQRGTLSPGRLADLVVLGDDITAIEPERIAATEVVATVLGGQFTHGAERLGTDTSTRKGMR